MRRTGEWVMFLSRSDATLLAAAMDRAVAPRPIHIPKQIVDGVCCHSSSVKIYVVSAVFARISVTSGNESERDELMKFGVPDGFYGKITGADCDRWKISLVFPLAVIFSQLPKSTSSRAIRRVVADFQSHLRCPPNQLARVIIQIIGIGKVLLLSHRPDHPE